MDYKLKFRKVVETGDGRKGEAQLGSLTFPDSHVLSNAPVPNTE